MLKCNNILSDCLDFLEIIFVYMHSSFKVGESGMIHNSMRQAAVYEKAKLRHPSHVHEVFDTVYKMVV